MPVYVEDCCVGWCSCRVDLRVGVIKKAWQHKEADSLYVEEVEVGEDAPRQVVSGLVKFIPEAQMQMRRCVLVCNLKPANMRGVKSHAMVLCATSADGLKVPFMLWVMSFTSCLT